MNIKDRAEKLQKVITYHKESCFNIILLQIDPDGLAASFGLRYLLTKFGIKRTRILYCGPIGHPQNKSIFDRYGLGSKISDLNDIRGSFTDKDVFCLVDSSSTKDGRLGEFRDFTPIIVIDHHRGSDIVETENSFAWVEDIGACSTLTTELISEFQLLDFNHENSFVPVLLALGVYTDTHNLIKGSSRDRNAFGLVSNLPELEQRDLQNLIEYPLPMAYINSLTYALNNSKRDGLRLVTNVGYINAENSDFISIIADFITQAEKTTLVVVWGIVEDGEKKFVRLSVRNNDKEVNLIEFLRKSFGNDTGAKLATDGSGAGGGRVDLGLGFWAHDNTKEEIIKLVDKRITDIVLN